VTAIEFSIRYSAERGFENAALALARRLFAVYDTGIDALMLVPDEAEDFTLYCNEQLITSWRRDGRDPTVADIRAHFGRAGITVERRPGPEAGVDLDDTDVN